MITYQMVDLMLECENPKLYKSLKRQGHLKSMVDSLLRQTKDTEDTVNHQMLVQEQEAMKDLNLGVQERAGRISMAQKQATEIALSQLRENLQQLGTTE